MSDVDDECYANLLYQAVEEQLRRREQLEQFIAEYSSTFPMLAFHTLKSDELPRMISDGKLHQLTEVLKDDFSEIFEETDEDGLPYHDDVLFTQYVHAIVAKSIAKNQETQNTKLMASSWQPSTDREDRAMKFVKRILNIYPDFGFTGELSRAFYVHSRFFHITRFAEYLSRIMLLMAKVGYKFNKLGQMYGMFHGNTVLPPENGYTRIFEMRESVTLGQLRDELMKRNSSAQLDDNFLDASDTVDTVAISYRHFAHGSQQRISDCDLSAIHRFLVASQEGKVRFWIDSKLPCTGDSSFERWLTRGVRPFARYFTLVCPSAYEENERYWIQMERIIAMGAQGIFFVTEDGVYFKKGFFSYRLLCHKMLTMMVGIDGIPPGMRRQDEGKVIQWALGFLGDQDSVRMYRFRGPRVDGLCNQEFSENVTMQNITLLIREYGSLVLPVETGRSWNEDNPLILKGTPDQILILPTWIGFSTPRDPRKILFFNGTTLPQVIYGGLVGLEVTLQENFVKGQKNEVVRKELRYFQHSELLQTSIALPLGGGIEQETDTAPDNNCLKVTEADFNEHILEALANEDALEENLKGFVRFLHRVRRGQQVNENACDSPSRTLSGDETSEVSNGPFWIKMKGLEAVIFPWECDWI